MAAVWKKSAAVPKVAGDEDYNDYWGIPGFGSSLKEALEPHTHLEPSWSPEEMEKRVGQKIVKAAKGFEKDERVQTKGTAVQARILVEAFVETAMGAISAGCYEKPWLFKVNFTGPLLAAAMYTFQGGKCFTRTLAPALEKYVEDGIFNWAEEERLSKAMQEAVEESGVKAGNYTKKAVKHLMQAFDDAHFKAPYGSHMANGQAEFGMLQDFVKGWISEFSSKAWDILSNGIDCPGAGTRDGQVFFLTVLFQNLTAPERACLPHELTSMIAEPPPNPWPFIGETVEAIIAENEMLEAQRASGPKRRRGGGGAAVGNVPAAPAAPQFAPWQQQAAVRPLMPVAARVAPTRASPPWAGHIGAL